MFGWSAVFDYLPPKEILTPAPETMPSPPKDKSSNAWMFEEPKFGTQVVVGPSWRSIVPWN